MRRVALCLAGQPRKAEHCFPNILDNLITPLNADVFIHFWDSIEGYSSQASCDQGRQSAKVAVSLYKPKLHIVEAQPDFIIDTVMENRKRMRADRQPIGHDRGRWGLGFNTLSKTTSIQKCHQLRQAYELENDFKYDLVIHCRTDWGFRSPFDIDVPLEEGCIYLTWDHIDACRPGKVAGLETHGCDNFLYGSSEVMDVFSNTRDWVWDSLQLPDAYGCSGEASMVRYLVKELGPDKLRPGVVNWGDKHDNNSHSWKVV